MNTCYVWKCCIFMTLYIFSIYCIFIAIYLVAMTLPPIQLDKSKFFVYTCPVKEYGKHELPYHDLKRGTGLLQSAYNLKHDLAHHQLQLFDIMNDGRGQEDKVLRRIIAEYGSFLQPLEIGLKQASSKSDRMKSTVCMPSTLTLINARKKELESKLVILRSNNLELERKLKSLGSNSIIASKKRLIAELPLSENKQGTMKEHVWKSVHSITTLHREDMLDTDKLEGELMRLTQETSAIQKHILKCHVPRSKSEVLKTEVEKQNHSKTMIQLHHDRLKEVYQNLSAAVNGLKANSNSSTDSPKKSLIDIVEESIAKYQQSTHDPLRELFDVATSGDGDDPGHVAHINQVITYMQKFQECMETHQYAIAARLAANSPKGALRNMATFKAFVAAKSSIAGKGTDSGNVHVLNNNPVYLYCSALVITGNSYEKLSAALSTEVIRCAISLSGIKLARFWLTKSCIDLSAPLADLLFSSCECKGNCLCGYVTLALNIFCYLKTEKKVALCLLKLGCLSSLILLAQGYGFSAADYKWLFLKHPSLKLYSKITDLSNDQDTRKQSAPLVSFPAALSVLLDANSYSDISDFMTGVLTSEAGDGFDCKTALLDAMINESSRDHMSVENWTKVIQICSMTGLEELAEEVYACLVTRTALDAASYHILTDYFS